MVRDLDPDTKMRAPEDLRSTLADHQTQQVVLYNSPSWLVEARRNRHPLSTYLGIDARSTGRRPVHAPRTRGSGVTKPASRR
jgi:hypothetical protein